MKKSILICFFISIVLLMYAIPEKSGSNSFVSNTIEVMLLGPKQYVRTDGAPNIFTDNFPGRVGQGKIIVTNGEVDGTEAISSAIIKINGNQIFGTSDFNQKIQYMEKFVSLQENNSISIELRSKPGSYLNIQIKEWIYAEAAAIIGDQGGVLEILDNSSELKGYRVEIPAGALNESAIISIRSEPNLSFPYNPARMEVVNLPAFRIEPSSRILNFPATIKVPYKDDDNDGIIDGTNMPAVCGQIFWMQEGYNELFLNDTHVDPSANLLITKTNHFSVWLPIINRWTNGTVKYFIESVPSSLDFHGKQFD